MEGETQMASLTFLSKSGEQAIVTLWALSCALEIKVIFFRLRKMQLSGYTIEVYKLVSGMEKPSEE